MPHSGLISKLFLKFNFALYIGSYLIKLVAGSPFSVP